eukprot:CAMPEP_0117485204 /NCGR_PEP_ID=MMETSP0784-20121206/14848_1 /TAXON_ID=39447 /ORGANISM="" /LENGTH=155 /DNA_ID=CAMNT_0005279791 /DNA_START=79 /DNA_END=546 /DNA_ORIENTATION=-
MSRSCAVVLAMMCFSSPVTAYVAPRPAHPGVASSRPLGADIAAAAPEPLLPQRAEPAATDVSNVFNALAGSCAVGMAIGFLRTKGQRAAAGAVAAATAGFAPVAAWAIERQSSLADSSSVTMAASEEALFYIFVIFLTLTVLILAIFLREAPGLD